MLFALPQVFILSLCVSSICGNDVIDKSAEATSTASFASATIRPLPHRNQTKLARNDQLLSLLANRRRQIIENRFKSHIKTIVELTKNGSPTTLPKKTDLPNNGTTVNIHLKLSELLNNNVTTTSDEQETITPSTEINIVNLPRSLQKKNGPPNRDTPQIQENKTKNMPIIRNILFRRKMSFLNRKLPLDFDQISYDTLGISEITKNTDDLLMDAEDSLQVEESSHDKLIYYDVKNNSSKSSMNNFDDASEETKTISMMNKTHHNNKQTSDIPDSKELLNLSKEASNSTDETTEPSGHLSTTEQNKATSKISIKLRHKENKTDTKAPKNTTHFMPQSLYNYFRPHEDVPEEEMQPFLHFGEKIPVTKHNTSRNQSFKPTQITPKERIFIEDNTTQKHEDEVDENMDVAITKPIYENKIPKVILPNQKTTVVQQYMKNRSYNITKSADARNSAEKKQIINIPQIRNLSRNRGFRNRTIFFHQKRNGMRHTINLKPNSSIADLKPITTQLGRSNITEIKDQNETTLKNKTHSEKMIIPSENISSTTEKLEISTKSQSIITNTISTATDSISSTSNVNARVTEAPTKKPETSTKAQEIRTITPELTIPVSKLTFSTEKLPRNSESTAKPTRRISTTVIIPTTRILSTDVVTSISIKSSSSEVVNKTKDFNETTNNHPDPEATVIAQLNNFTSQTFQNKNITVTNSTRVTMVSNKSKNITNHAINKTGEIDKPLFYLNKTDFIIHVPDVEATTELFSETELQTEATKREPATKHTNDHIRISSRINTKDITKTEVTTQQTIKTTSKHVTPSIQTTRTISYKPTERTTKYLTTTERKKILSVFNSSMSDTASELPLATLFSVIDYKKSEAKNATLPSRIIPATETVISRKKDANSTFDNIHAAYILASLGLIPMAVIIIYVIRNLMKRKNKCFEDFEAEMQDDKATIITPVARLPALVVDSSSKWEFPRAKLRLQTLLGQGNFGQVWKAEADDLKGHVGLTRLVAVKTVKDGSGSKEKDDLLKELEIMQKMGAHPNVVTLLGCCTEKEPCLLIMEYVMYGKLLTYLRDHRTRQDYFNFSDDAATLTARDLTVFAYCVARGMEYLGTKGIIHRDLAARNILVDHNKLCKIADFGMSRDCHEAGNEEITEPRQARNALPVRWMSIESLLYSVFTYKTDVWSFGVLLWEIVTLGSSPYANMSGREVMRLICDGYRLERPNHCKPELYNVMARTWHVNPDQRPSFAELRTELAEMLENTAAEGSYVDLESFRADSTVYEIDNCTPRGNYFTVKSRFSEFECDI